MKISKALKLKKFIVGELNKVANLIKTENVQLNANTSKFNVSELYKEYQKKSDELLAIKTQIAVANSAIWDKVFRIVELKNRVAFLNSIDTKEGKFQESQGYNVATTLNEYKPQLDKVFIKSEVEKLENEIQQLQDAIDEFNATTQV